LLREGLTATDDPTTRADIQWERARLQATRGSPAEAQALLSAEAARIERHDRARAGSMLLEAALAAFMVGRPRGTLDLAVRASRLLEPDVEPAAPITALMIGVGRVLTGDSEGGERLLARARPLVSATPLTVMGPMATLLLFAEVWLEH